jgi:CubicO group peptidase (beta-lactamase class C family)
MHHTGYARPRAVMRDLAVGYRRQGDSLVEWRDRHNADFTFSSGALYSTVGDLLLWDKALYTEKLVKKKALESMFQAYTPRYGYGWYVSSHNGHKTVSHPGHLPGFSSYILRSLEDRVCIIILSNIGGVPVGEIGNNLSYIAFGKNYEQPPYEP